MDDFIPWLSPIYSFSFIFDCTLRQWGSSFPDEELKPHPLPWKAESSLEPQGKYPPQNNLQIFKHG